MHIGVRRDITATKSHLILSLFLFLFCNPLPREIGAAMVDAPSFGSLGPHGHFIEIQIADWLYYSTLVPFISIISLRGEAVSWKNFSFCFILSVCF